MAEYKVRKGYVVFGNAGRIYEEGAVVDESILEGQMHKVEPVVVQNPEPVTTKEEPKEETKEQEEPKEEIKEDETRGSKQAAELSDGAEQDADERTSGKEEEK